MEKWCKLNELLRESLATKHGLNVTMEHEKILPHSEAEIDIPTEVCYLCSAWCLVLGAWIVV